MADEDRCMVEPQLYKSARMVDTDDLLPMPSGRYDVCDPYVLSPAPSETVSKHFDWRG